MSGSVSPAAIAGPRRAWLPAALSRARAAVDAGGGDVTDIELLLLGLAASREESLRGQAGAGLTRLTSDRRWRGQGFAEGAALNEVVGAAPRPVLHDTALLGRLLGVSWSFQVSGPSRWRGEQVARALCGPLRDGSALREAPGKAIASPEEQARGLTALLTLARVANEPAWLAEGLTVLRALTATDHVSAPLLAAAQLAYEATADDEWAATADRLAERLGRTEPHPDTIIALCRWDTGEGPAWQAAGQMLASRTQPPVDAPRWALAAAHWLLPPLHLDVAYHAIDDIHAGPIGEVLCFPYPRLTVRYCYTEADEPVILHPRFGSERLPPLDDIGVASAGLAALLARQELWPLVAGAAPRPRKPKPAPSASPRRRSRLRALASRLGRFIR